MKSNQLPHHQMRKESYADLTTKWYQKLAKEGFEDIEWYDPRTGMGQNGLLRRSALLTHRRYKKETAEHYRIVTNFCTHYTFPTKKDRFIMELYANGITYRDIVKMCIDKGKGYGYSNKASTKGKRNISLFSLHTLIKKWVKEAYIWNRSHPEGIMLELPDNYFDLMDAEAKEAASANAAFKSSNDLETESTDS